MKGRQVGEEGSRGIRRDRLLLVGVQCLLQRNTELLAYRLELLKVFCVLTLVLNLEFDA